MSSVSGVSSTNTLTQILTVGGATTTSTQTTTATSFSDLGVPYVHSTAGLPSPSAPGDTEALLALIMSKVQEAVGQTRNNETLTEAQRTLGLLTAIQAGIADYVAASAAITNAKATIASLKLEKQQNNVQIAGDYQRLTGDANATGVGNVPPDPSGAHGVYGIYLDKLSTYSTASKNLDDANTALATAQSQQSADVKDASDYKTTTLNPTLSNLYNALVKIGAGTATASDRTTVTNALGTSNSGLLATTLATYQGKQPPANATYWQSTMVPLLNSLASVRDANPITDMTTAVNLLSTTGNGSASSQLATYKGKIDTLNSKASDPTNGYQATITARQSDVAARTADLRTALRDLSPYLDFKSANGTVVTFSDPSTSGKTYTVDFAGTPMPTMNQTGLVSALLDPINTLTARNAKIGDENTPGTLIYDATTAMNGGLTTLTGTNSLGIQQALVALSTVVGTAPSIDTGDDKDTRFFNESGDNLDRAERDRLAENDKDAVGTVTENDKEAAALRRIRELQQTVAVGTATLIAKSVVDVLVALQRLAGDGGGLDTTERLAGRGPRVRVAI